MSHSPALADLAAGLRMCADAVARIVEEAPERTRGKLPTIEMLTPEQGCELVAGRDKDGRLRIKPKTLAARTRGQDFRRGGSGRVLTYERSGLEQWLRRQR